MRIKVKTLVSQSAAELSQMNTVTDSTVWLRRLHWLHYIQRCLYFFWRSASSTEREQFVQQAKLELFTYLYITWLWRWRDVLCVPLWLNNSSHYLRYISSTRSVSCPQLRCVLYRPVTMGMDMNEKHNLIPHEIVLRGGVGQIKGPIFIYTVYRWGPAAATAVL